MTEHIDMRALMAAQDREASKIPDTYVRQVDESHEMALFMETQRAYLAEEFETHGAWVVGHNTAGYLPDTDPSTYTTWTEASEAYVDMCRSWADADDESFEESLEDVCGSS